MQLPLLHHRPHATLPFARRYFYYLSQRRSWSIKAVLPTIADDLRFGAFRAPIFSLEIEASRPTPIA